MHAGFPLWGNIQPGSCLCGNGKRAYATALATSYSVGNKQTVPLEQLEKDLQEGSEKEPWRRGITDRTAIMDRNTVVYGILKAQQDGHDLKEFMNGQIKRAEDAMKKARMAGFKRPLCF